METPTRHLYTPSGLMRARALGIPFEGTPGPLNAITDLDGVQVGYSTIIRGEGVLVVGSGPVRTGVTVILPRGRDGATDPVFAGFSALNGNGEMTGTLWIEEAGVCEWPIAITNTHSVGIVRDAIVKWIVEHRGVGRDPWWALPVVAETYDGWLNDVNGFHVREEHVYAAIDSAHGGPIEEGSVGGGTGMICYGYKGGSGTSSRVVQVAGRTYIVGALVQANFGERAQLTIAGVPVGRHLSEGRMPATEAGSIIAVVATNAPVLPHQLKRMARRIALGVGRSGSTSGNGSGDIFMAFSTANAAALANDTDVHHAQFLSNGLLDALFDGVVQSVDESIINALVANGPMVGVNGRVVDALPHDSVRAMMQRYHRP